MDKKEVQGIIDEIKDLVERIKLKLDNEAARGEAEFFGQELIDLIEWNND